MNLQIRRISETELHDLTAAVQDYVRRFGWFYDGAYSRRYALRQAFKILREAMLAGYSFDGALADLEEARFQMQQRMEG